MDAGARKFGIALALSLGLLQAQQYGFAVAVFIAYTVANVVLKLKDKAPEDAE